MRWGFKQAGALLMALGMSAALSAQEPVRISAEKLTEQIHMLQGQGGNLGLMVGEEATFLVDDQFAPLTDQIVAAVEAAGGEHPDFLLNTHFHGDHTGGNENLGKGGTLIVSHHNVRERLSAESFVAAFKMKRPALPRVALPVVTFSKELVFHLNGERIRVFHVPHAHTDGDAVVQFEKANVIHAGDIFFNGFYPFVDVDHGGSLQGMIRGAERILALADDETRIIPGHGPLGNRAQLGAYHEMLQTAHQRLKSLKEQGLTLEEVVARKPLKDLEPTWGDGMFVGDRWIAVVWNGLY